VLAAHAAKHLGQLVRLIAGQIHRQLGVRQHHDDAMQNGANGADLRPIAT
jgi:hypothetical protein